MQDENPIEEAKLIQAIEANDKLETIGRNTEASLLVQSELKNAIDDLKAPLDAIAVNSEKPETQKIEILGAEIMTIKGQKGDKGDKGDDGKTPSKEELVSLIEPLIPEPIKGEDGVNGIDGIDGKDGRDGKDGIDGRNGTDGNNGKDGKAGKNGKDGSPDTPEQVAEKLNKLSKAIDFKVIKNFPDFAKNNGGNGIGYIREASDVQITNIASGDLLQWNGTRWINTAFDDNGIRSLNGLTGATQVFAVGTSGTDFSISSVGTTHTFNLPTASTVNRGALSSADWSTFNAKASTLASVSALSTDTAKSLYQMTSGANVEFRASDASTLTYWDEANKRFGIGTNAPDTTFHAFGTAFPVGLIERQVTNTNSGGSAMGVRTTSTGNMTDGFGTGFTLQIEDNAGVANPIANFFASRNGADNTGKLAINVYNAGAVVEAMTLLNTGNVGIGVTPSAKLHIEGNTIVSGNGTFLVGAVGSNLTILGTAPRIQAVGASGIAISSVGVADGTNNRRIGMYVDQTNGTLGLNYTRSSGAVPFFITDVSTNRMLIDVNGNIGFGTGAATTAPRKVSINSDTDASLYIRRNTTTTGDYAEILFQTSTADLYATGIRSQRVASGFSDILFMGQQTAGSTYANLYEIARFTAPGKFGIGTGATVRSKFEVSGSGSNTVGISTSLIGLQSTASSAHQWGLRLGATSGELNFDSNFGGVDINIVKFERSGSMSLGGSNTPAINFGFDNTTANILSFDSSTATTQNVQLRMFRLTNTTGSSTGLTIHSADGTAGVNGFLSAKGNSYVGVIAGNFGVGVTSPLGKFDSRSTSRIQIVGSYDASNYLSILTGSTGSTTFDLVGTSPTFQFSKDVGIGGTPSAKLHVLATTEQLRLGYDASNYLSTTISSAGIATFALTGTGTHYNFNSGILRGNSLHDNALAQGSATQQDIRSGTYTPTITGVANVSSSTARQAQWSRVGNVVTVSGQLEITATSNNTETTFGVSLPVSSDFTTAYQAGGAGYTKGNTVAGHGLSIYADATNNRAEFNYYETHGGTDTFTYTFTYEVL